MVGTGTGTRTGAATTTGVGTRTGDTIVTGTGAATGMRTGAETGRCTGAGVVVAIGAKIEEGGCGMLNDTWPSVP